MTVRSGFGRWLFRRFWGQTATHIGLYVGGKVYHITYTKGLRISSLENVLAANFLLAVAPMPARVTSKSVEEAAGLLQTRAYNKPLFWYMFLRRLCENWRIWTPELFRDPDKVMCADLLSFTFDGKLVSHALTPESVFNHYLPSGATKQRLLLEDKREFSNEEVA